MGGVVQGVSLSLVVLNINQTFQSHQHLSRAHVNEIDGTAHPFLPDRYKIATIFNYIITNLSLAPDSFRAQIFDPRQCSLSAIHAHPVTSLDLVGTASGQ